MDYIVNKRGANGYKKHIAAIGRAAVDLNAKKLIDPWKKHQYLVNMGGSPAIS